MFQGLAASFKGVPTTAQRCASQAAALEEAQASQVRILKKLSEGKSWSCSRWSPPEQMGVSTNNGTPKSSHFNRVFHYKPSIFRYPYCWKHPSAKYSKEASAIEKKINPRSPILGNLFFFSSFVPRHRNQQLWMFVSMNSFLPRWWIIFPYLHGGLSDSIITFRHI